MQLQSEAPSLEPSTSLQRLNYRSSDLPIMGELSLG
jgi:hypothetical protein